MSSSDRQQKRAKRAKAKAKQQRIQRNTGSSRTADAYTDQYPPQVLEHFHELQLAEAISLEEMLVEFLQGPLAALAFELDNGEEGDAQRVGQRLMHLLSMYWDWSEELDEQATLERLNSAQFDTAMRNASTFVKELEQAQLEIVEEHFQAVKKAEAISQEEMIKTLFEGPLMPFNDDPTSDEPDYARTANELATVFARYWAWSENLDEDAIIARLSSPQFVQDMDRARTRIIAKDS